MVSEVASIEQTYEQQADIYPKICVSGKKLSCAAYHTYPDGCPALDDINVVIGNEKSVSQGHSVRDNNLAFA